MQKLKLEKIAGIVALTYLLLIPAGAVYVWRKMEAMDKDVTEMWEKLEMSPTQATPIFDFNKMMGGLRRGLQPR